MFLFGIEQLTDSLKSVAGDGMKTLLSRMTTNRFKAAITGAFVTGVIQSSSVTTVLVVGFISAGLLTLQQSIGIIMGANIGSTLTAQLIAFDISIYAMLVFCIGFALRTFFKNPKLKIWGVMLMGLGMLFIGMEMMSETTRPLRTHEPFIEMMQKMDNPLLGILVGALFTAVVQSSAATTGIVIALAAQGLVSLPAGIAIAFGANIGTCVTALLATINQPREALQAALVHVLFNVLGVLIWLFFIDQLSQLVVFISPTSTNLEGADKLAAEVPRQIANAHTIFNVANTFIFIWFVNPMAKLVMKLAPIKPLPKEESKSKYLRPALLETPALALDQVRLETAHLGSYTLTMMHQSTKAVIDGSRDDLEYIQKMDRDIHKLHREILGFLRQLTMEESASTLQEGINKAVTQASYIENISDQIHNNIIVLGLERLENKIVISEDTQKLMRPFVRKICGMFEMAVKALREQDEELATQIIDSKREVYDLAHALRDHLIQRLTAEGKNRRETFRIESDLMEKYRGLYYLTRRLAKSILRNDN